MMQWMRAVIAGWALTVWLSPDVSARMSKRLIVAQKRKQSGKTSKMQAPQLPAARSMSVPAPTKDHSLPLGAYEFQSEKVQKIRDFFFTHPHLFQDDPLVEKRIQSADIYNICEGLSYMMIRAKAFEEVGVSDPLWQAWKVFYKPQKTPEEEALLANYIKQVMRVTGGPEKSENYVNCFHTQGGWFPFFFGCQTPPSVANGIGLRSDFLGVSQRLEQHQIRFVLHSEILKNPDRRPSNKMVVLGAYHDVKQPCHTCSLYIESGYPFNGGVLYYNSLKDAQPRRFATLDAALDAYFAENVGPFFDIDVLHRSYENTAPQDNISPRELERQIADYWKRDPLENGGGQAQKFFWQNMLAKDSPVLQATLKVLMGYKNQSTSMTSLNFWSVVEAMLKSDEKNVLDVNVLRQLQNVLPKDLMGDDIGLLLLIKNRLQELEGLSQTQTKAKDPVPVPHAPAKVASSESRGWKGSVKKGWNKVSGWFSKAPQTGDSVPSGPTSETTSFGGVEGKASLSSTVPASAVDVIKEHYELWAVCKNNQRAVDFLKVIFDVWKDDEKRQKLEMFLKDAPESIRQDAVEIRDAILQNDEKTIQLIAMNPDKNRRGLDVFEKAGIRIKSSDSWDEGSNFANPSVLPERAVQPSVSPASTLMQKNTVGIPLQSFEKEADLSNLMRKEVLELQRHMDEQKQQREILEVRTQLNKALQGLIQSPDKQKNLNAFLQKNKAYQKSFPRDFRALGPKKLEALLLDVNQNKVWLEILERAGVYKRPSGSAPLTALSGGRVLQRGAVPGKGSLATSYSRADRNKLPSVKKDVPTALKGLSQNSPASQRRSRLLRP